MHLQGNKQPLRTHAHVGSLYRGSVRFLAMVHAAACVGLNLLESISSVDRGWLLDPTPQGMRHELVRMGFGPFEDWEFITSGMHAVRSRPYDQTKVMLGIIKLYET